MMRHPISKTDCHKADAILSLGQKLFYLRPVCLDKYLRSLNITDVSREVFWLHWSTGYMQGSIETQLSVKDVAEQLQICTSSVSRAYEQLKAVGLITRVTQRDTSHGGMGVTLTVIDIPDAVLKSLLASNPDRSTIGSTPRDINSEINVTEELLPSVAPDDTPQDVSQEEEVPTNPIDHTIDDYQQRIEQLNVTIEQENQRTVTCSQAGDIVGFRKAVAAVEKAKTEKKHLQSLIDQANNAKNTSPPSVPVKTTPAVKPNNPPDNRQVSPATRQHITHRVQAIERVSDPHGVVDEIVYSIERGVQSTRPVPHAINAALRMVQRNQWRTPIGFQKRTNQKGVCPN